MLPTRNKRVMTVAVLVAASLALSACGGGSEPKASSKDFPSSQFPDSTYKGLSGSVAWYDSSGGATTKARMESTFKDFTDLTGVKTQNDFTGDTAKFFAASEQGKVPWSFVEFPTKGDFLRAEAAGYLQKLDPKVVQTDKMQDGTYDEYGVDVMRYGFVLTYNTKKWPESGKHPESIADLYDTTNFPGKRCMYQYPQYGATLESALLADGVTRDSLYPLDTNRAYKKLDTIKKDIVWWSDGDEAIRLLTTGECDMGITWSGRAYNAVAKDKANLAISWKDSFYTDAVYAIPKGAPNPKAGQALLAMQLDDTKGQIKQVSAIPYPTAIKDLTESSYPADLRGWLPIGDNAKAAIPEDEPYYQKNITGLVKDFNAWVSKK